MAFRTNKTPVLQTKSASGAVASFNTALAMPLPSCNIAVNAYQEGSGDPSPVNVRNIVPYNKLRINMVDFNQIASPNVGGAGHNGIKIINVVNGVFELTGTTTAGYAALFTSQNLYANHKYFIAFRSVYNPDNLPMVFSALNTSGVAAVIGRSVIGNCRQNVRSTIGFSGMTNGGNYTGVKGSVIFCDLTQMFGSKIADYLYNLETQTAGAGVALFKQIFYKDYYDYNAGGTWVSVASVNGDNYPDYAEVNLGEDTYGSVYNSVTGVKKDNKVKIVIDGTEDLKIANQNYIKADACDCYFVNADIYPMLSYRNQPETLCNKLKFSNGAIWTELGYANTFTINQQQIHMNIANDLLGITDYTQETPTTALAKMKAFFETNNIEVLIPVTETETQLTPQEIETLIGNNTIFADTGDVNLTYNYLDLAKRGSFREVFKLPS